MTSEKLLEFVKSEILDIRECVVSILEQGKNLTAEEWDNTRLLEGQIIAYEHIIKRIKNLSEREFQLEKKKGTL